MRSLLKALSYRIVASLITSALVYAITHKAALALGVGLMDSLIKIVTFFLHERLWALIPIGRKAHPLSGIDVNRSLSVEHEQLLRKQLSELGYMSK